MKRVIQSFVVIPMSFLIPPSIALGDDLKLANDQTVAALVDVSGVADGDRYTDFQRFADIAGILNEVEERRRRIVYQQYPGLATQGVVHAFVHVTDGSAAFAKTDMVVRAAMPVVIRRAYQSRRNGSPNFGQSGWELSIAEEITLGKSGRKLRYRYGNHLGIEFLRRGEMVAPVSSATTDVASISFAAPNRIVVQMRSGIRKEFLQMADSFLLDTVVDNFGNSHKYDYLNGFLSGISTNDGVRVTLTRGADQRISAIRDSSGRTVTYGYTPTGALATTTDLRGEIWKYTYDANGYIESAETPMGTTDLVLKHDHQGKVVLTVVNGREHRFAYTKNRTVVTSGDDERPITFESHRNGVTATVVNKVGTVSNVGLDKFGRPVTVTRNSQLVSEIAYDRKGRAARPATQRIYVAGSDRYATVLFDDQVRVLSLNGARNSNSYSVSGYAGGTRPEVIVFDDKSSIAVSTNATGLPTYVAPRGAQALKFEWSGETVTVESAGQTATLEFDNFGSLLSLDAPDGRRLDFTYDEGGFRESTTLSDGINMSYSYSPAGTLIHTETFSPTTGTANFIYEVDPDEYLRQITGDGVDGHHVFGYTDSGRVRAIDSTVTNSFTFLYDDQNRLEVAVPNGYEPLVYRYALGEPDIVAQHDSRTKTIYTQNWDINEFETLFDRYYGRSTASQLGLLTYDESLAEIRPAIDPIRWHPASHLLGAVENTKLKLLFDETSDVGSFSMPSNRFFVPAEYWAVNCCFCCSNNYIACEIP